MRIARLGVTTAEYCLIGALVLLPALGTVGVLGKNVSAMFTGMLGSATPMVAAATPVSSGTPPGTASGETPATGSATPAPGNPGAPTTGISIQLPGGPLALSSYPSDFQKTIETAGTNGTTSILLGNLDSVIQELAAKGNITPEQTGILEQLSNQGHRIAQAEKIMEDAAANAADSNAYYNTAVTWNGQNMTIEQMMHTQIGWEGNGATTGDGLPDGVSNPLTTDNANPETLAFIQLYQQAQASGALNDPTVNSTITGLTKQIGFLSEMGQWGPYNVADLQADPATIKSIEAQQTNYLMQYAPPITSSTVSGQTNGASTAICTTGGSTDSGVNCGG